MIILFHNGGGAQEKDFPQLKLSPLQDTPPPPPGRATAVFLKIEDIKLLKELA